MERCQTSIYKPEYELTPMAKDYWIRRTIREKGRAWVIGAMVEGSIGYHTPTHANRLIDRFLEGKKTDWCERCDACYKCDLLSMMYDDIAQFDWIAVERSNKIVEAMKVVINWTDDQQMSMSFAYPTMGI